MHSDCLLVKVEGEERAEGEWLSQERSHKLPAHGKSEQGTAISLLPMLVIVDVARMSPLHESGSGPRDVPEALHFRVNQRPKLMARPISRSRASFRLYFVHFLKPSKRR